MVSSRCIKVVRETLESLGLNVPEVGMGYARIDRPGSAFNLGLVSDLLNREGFELIVDRQAILTEKVKLALLERLDRLVRQEPTEKLSVYLSECLNLEYSLISKTFSKIEGQTINSYFIKLKLEKVKEFIDYGALSFKEIAYSLGYSSLQHLSGQFRQIEGVSMSDYKLQKGNLRGPPDKIL